ncbi:MAG: heavy-metal-associated domain-containing protein [Proteobacteria bacterium]|uniref:heavy-metal-associated domain-containing protein n=1 Tax=Rudaea sp. TaxID=2136325 RepID=UPI0032203C45|nr:heavy-metal-associated domain-containing protein [Pseudomonadota bacterium]
MKSARNILLSLLAAVAGAVTPALPAAAATIEMDVNGLVCAFCAQGIEKKLRAFPATADVVVSLEKRLVALSTIDGADIGDEELRKALTDAGYTVKAIRRESESLDDVRRRLGVQR